MEIKQFTNISFDYFRSFVSHVSEMFQAKGNLTEVLSQLENVEAEFNSIDCRVSVNVETNEKIHITQVGFYSTVFGYIRFTGEFSVFNMIGDLEIKFEPAQDHLTIIDLIADFEDENECIEQLTEKALEAMSELKLL